MNNKNKIEKDIFDLFQEINSILIKSNVNKKDRYKINKNIISVMLNVFKLGLSSLFNSYIIGGK